MRKRREICLSYFGCARIGSFEVISLEAVKNVLLGILLALFAAALLLFPADAAGAAREGLSLCLTSVLPSLFPFFVLSSLCVSSGAAEALARLLTPLMRPLFGVGGAGAGALALGLVGGYPVGARTAAELYRRGAVTKSEAERLLGFCSNAGPGFILGVCGSVLQNQRAGAYLYLVHVASALLAGLLLRVVPAGRAAERRAWTTPAAAKRAADFPAAVRESFAAVWSVCGFVVIFAVVLRLLTLALPEGAADAPWYPALLGFAELTNGALAVRPGRAGFVLCAALLGWGGLSVHAQTLSVLDGTGLSVRWYFPGKALHAALSALLAYACAGMVY
ncbi:MAG: sporulation protein [Ruminococcaceae bacterium]|nr:sporulation protein [Oscillospiraceae bacterium]